VAYAVFDEWHQSFVAGRNASVSDVIVDVIGAALMLLVIGCWSLLRARRSRTPAESQS
jgi:VanZ family protein